VVVVEGGEREPWTGRRFLVTDYSWWEEAVRPVGAQSDRSLHPCAIHVSRSNHHPTQQNHDSRGKEIWKRIIVIGIIVILIIIVIILAVL
jgi:hypothetical protein